MPDLGLTAEADGGVDSGPSVLLYPPPGLSLPRTADVEEEWKQGSGETTAVRVTLAVLFIFFRPQAPHLKTGAMLFQNVDGPEP